MDELRETKKVTVLSVEPVRQLSRGTVLDFKGRDESGLVLKYSVFSLPLQAMVKQGEELTLEVITTSRETESGTFVNHKVVAINGQVGGARPGTGGGYRTDSPETRASIEAQSALQAIVELRKSDKLSDDSPVYKRALKWCEVALSYSPCVLKLDQSGTSSLAGTVKATTLPAEGRIIRPRVASTSRD